MTTAIKPNPANPKYKPLTDAQFAKQWKTYIANNPDVAIEFGNNLEGALRHYKEFGIGDIQSGFRAFSKKTPQIIQEYGLKYPEAFKLVDPKTKRHTTEYTKYFPEQAREYIRENYTTIYDKTPNLFDANDLKFLRDQKITADQITDLARSYGIGSINPNLLKYDSKTKKYAAAELSPIAADIFANYGNYDVGQKGIFDQADVNLLRSLGYKDADITSRATTLFGEDRLSPEVIQQYFPNLAFRPASSLYIQEPITFDRTPQTEKLPGSTPSTIGGRPIEATEPRIEESPAPTTSGTGAPTATPETSYEAFFRGIPGINTATESAPPIDRPRPQEPVIDYFAKTPIASPFPTLPYRFKTLTPEGVNLRQGLGTLPTSNPLLQAAPAPAAPAPVLNPQTQIIRPSPTVAAEVQAYLNAQQEAQNAAALEAAASTTPTTAPVTGRMGGMVSFAEGGMPKFTPAEVGSEFSVQDYVNPETGKFYINEFKRDEVFNPRLRQAEAEQRAEDPLRQLEEMDRAEKQRLSDILMYQYGIRRPRSFGLAEGGLASAAENLADKGRGPDTMLVHMAPDEVAGLQALAQRQGTSLTINPYTGLPEAFSLSSLNPVKLVKKAYKEVVKPIVKSDVFKAVAPILPFLPIPGIQALSLLQKAALSGVIGGFTAPGKGFNFQQGLKTGLLAYGGAKLMQGMQAPGAEAAGGGVDSIAGVKGAAATPGTSAVVTPDAVSGAAPLTASDLPGAMETLSPPPTTTATGPAFSYTPAGEAMPVGTGEVLGGGTMPGSVSLTPSQLARTEAISAMQGTPTAAAPAASQVGGFERLTGVSPRTAIMGGYAGTSLYGAKQAKDEMAMYEEEQRRLAAEEEERRRRFNALYDRTLGRIPMAAGGGIVALNRGGMPTFEYGGTTAPTGEPRMVTGAGDGMSDNVPATIEGVQEARLANDEFVVPADVVADIGNGSSNAGAKKLYAMMDRVRKARHGTTKQPPEIRAERLMPA